MQYKGKLSKKYPNVYEVTHTRILQCVASWSGLLSQSLSACCCSTCCFKGYQFKDACMGWKWVGWKPYLLYYAPSFCLFSHQSHVYLHFIFWYAVGWLSEVGGCSWDYGRWRDGEQNNYVSEARPVCSAYLYRELKHQALPILMPTSKLFLVSFKGSSLWTNFAFEYREERGNEAVFFLFSFSLPFLLSSFTSPSTQISLSI